MGEFSGATWHIHNDCWPSWFGGGIKSTHNGLQFGCNVLDDAPGSTEEIDVQLCHQNPCNFNKIAFKKNFK